MLCCSVLQSFVATVMARPLTAHMIHLVIPGVKEYIPLSSIISAVKTTSSQNMFIQDTLYCLLSIVEGRIGVCVCVCVCVCVFVCGTYTVGNLILQSYHTVQ